MSIQGAMHWADHRTRAQVQVLLEANAMVICSLIHASILRIGRSYVSSVEEADFMARARAFGARQGALGMKPV